MRKNTPAKKGFSPFKENKTTSERPVTAKRSRSENPDGTKKNAFKPASDEPREKRARIKPALKTANGRTPFKPKPASDDSAFHGAGGGKGKERSTPSGFNRKKYFDTTNERFADKQARKTAPREDGEQPYKKPRREDDRNDKPSFRDRAPRKDDDKPSFRDRKSGGRSDDKPSFRDRKDSGADRKPSFKDRPSRDGDDKPSFRDRAPRKDDDKPSFRDRKSGRSDDKPSFRDRKDSGADRKPSFKDRAPRKDDDKPSFRDRAPRKGDDKPSFRDRKSGGRSDDKPSFKDRASDKAPGKRAAFKARGEDDKKPSFRDRKPGGRSDEKPSFKDRKPRKDEDDDDQSQSETYGPGEMPLNKYIAHSGLCSRRKAVDYVKEGNVTVNGATVVEPAFKVVASDDVRIKDRRITIQKNLVYILLNKPKGYITTTDDPEGRRTVMELVADATEEERVYPVGRLDRNTSGLLLLTNDGELAQKLAHPKNNIKKIYHVGLDKPLTKADFDHILQGVTLEDGVANVDALGYVEAGDKTQVGIEIHSGKNRIVRRIFEHLEYQVEKLDRVTYAGLTKKNIVRGKWRFLTEKEVILLKHFK